MTSGDNSPATSTYIHTQTNINQNLTPEVESARAEKNKQNYLEAVKCFCQALNTIPLGKEANDITLDQIYIDLNTTEQVPVENKGKRKDGRLEERQLRPDADTQPLPALQAVARSKKVVLLGAPGAGKSTFVKKVCGLLARAQLDGKEPPPGFSSELVPIFITLRDLSKHLRVEGFEDKSANDLKILFLDAFKEQLKEELARLDASDYFDSLMDLVHKGQCLLVLDGLDEVPYDLRPRVRQFAGKLIETYAPKRFIVTCRIRSYSGSTEIPGFERYTLAPFDEKQISDFIRAWYNAFQKEYPAAQIKVRQDDLTRAALAADLNEMASNPMLLTVMAIIHQEDVHLPPEKVKLYKRAIEILLRRWQIHKSGELSPSPRLEQFLKDNQHIYPALERLAYAAQRARREDRRDAPELLRRDALDLLECNECLCEDGYPSLAIEFLDYVDQRAGLLVGKGEAPGLPASYAFPHRTFQEYLAGCHLASQRNFFRALCPLAAEGDTWDLALQMAIEELYYNSRGGAFTLMEASYELCKPCSDNNETQQRLTLWAGQIAVLIGKKEYEKDEDLREKSALFLENICPCLIQVLTGGLPPVERAEAGNALARLGDPRPEVMTVEAMQFCFVPEGPFWMGEGEEARQISLPDYWLGLHPVSNAQFEIFVKDDGYTNPAWWDEAKKAKMWSQAGFKGRYDDESRLKPVFLRESFGLPNQPVVGVSWYEALAFTLWLDASSHEKKWLPDHLHIRLPTEQEWEKAARGGENLPEQPIIRELSTFFPPEQFTRIPNPDSRREYSWIGDFNTDKTNTEETGIGSTSPLSCFGRGAGPYGNLDLSGNVWEWLENWYGKDQGSKTLRGGSWYRDRWFACCSSRVGGNPVYGYSDYGFRCFLRAAP